MGDASIADVLKVAFPILLVVGGVVPFVVHGRYNVVHEYFVQILAVVLFVPAVIYCMAFGLISENGGVGLLGSMIGYVFGSTVGRKNKSNGE